MMANGSLLGKNNIPNSSTATGLWKLPEQHIAKLGTGWPTAIDTTNLVVYYDGPSYSGTTWTNLASTGSTYNGAMSNVSYSSADLAMSFNGTSSYVQMTRPVADDFTLICLFKTTQSSGSSANWYQGMGLIDGEVGGSTNDFGLSIGAAKVLFGTGAPDTTVASTSTYNDGNWHVAAGTRTKSTGSIKLYVDGSQVATATASTSSLTAPTNLTVGRIQAGGNFFQGSIARVMIYSRVLSATDITANYNSIRR